ncbi:MAG TPA: zinc ribbon domain-containing protein [Thermomicrobiaceae bacterium]|nr:zinc ribbon domain-containing protein [Thermomicrobiaceae bacterium]
MFCPRCGARGEPGAQRCAECGAPFTRRSAAGQPPARRAAPAARQPASYRTYHRGSGVGRAVVAWLVVLFLAAVAVLALITVFSSSVIKPFVGQQLEQSLAAPTSTATATSAPAAAPTAQTAEASPRQAVITEQQLNQGIAEHQDQLGPLDSVQVTIDADELAVELSSHGLSGTYHGQVTVQDGKPALANGHIDGLLGHVIPTRQLEDVLNQQIDAALAQSGVAVRSVTLQPGQMVVGYS